MNTLHPKYSKQSGKHWVAKFKLLSNRRLILMVTSIVVAALLSFGGIYAYYGYDGLPQTLFFRGTARHYCIVCGSQAISHMTTLFGSLPLTSTQPTIVLSPSIDGPDPTRCEHKYLIIAAIDHEIELRSLRLKHWSMGKIEGDPFWSQPALARAFADLSRSRVEDSGQLFSYLIALNYRGRVSSNLLEVLSGTNSDKVISVLSQVYTNSGNVLASQKTRK